MTIDIEVIDRFEEICDNVQLNPHRRGWSRDSNGNTLGHEYANESETVGITPPGGQKINGIDVSRYNQRTTDVRIEYDDSINSDVVIFEFSDTPITLKRNYVDMVCDVLDYSLKEYIKSTRFITGLDTYHGISAALTMDNRAFALVAPRASPSSSS